jgi:hypothetical protein
MSIGITEKDLNRNFQKGKYHITRTHYRDMYGNFLWSEIFIWKRLNAIGQDVVEKGVYYIVKRVAVVNNIEHVNLEKQEKRNERES